MLATYVSNAEFNLKNTKSLITSFAIIGIPAVVVLSIPDVGSLLVFAAFFIALYREGLSGKLFLVGALFGAVFLIANYLNDPLHWSLWYFTLFILIMGGIWFAFNAAFLRKNMYTLLPGAGIILLLAILSFVSPVIFEKLPTHQQERVEVLYKGEREFRDTSGYNLLYSKTAIGSGGLLGKGYREGSVTQGKFVPEQETDYIFCTVGEEWALQEALF